jgi:hypothetical protein
LENRQFNSFELTDNEIAEMDRDINDYLSGRTKGYSFEEAKIMARNGYGL